MLELENFETLCSLSEGLVDVCKPLALINLDYFHYVKVYDDGSRISLTNKSEWMRHYCARELYLMPTISKKNDSKK